MSRLPSTLAAALALAAPAGGPFTRITEGRRSNRMGIGLRARTPATVAGRPVWQTRWHDLSTGYGSQNAPELHFGLGDAAVVDTLRAVR